MLEHMRRLLFTSVLAAALAASAHDEHGACSEAEAASTPSATGPAALGRGAVLLRGEPLPPGRTAVSVTGLLAAPRDGSSVLVEGVVRRACSHRGCWMELAAPEGGRGVRVTFQDEGFFVPTDSAGARARVQGTVKVRPPPSGSPAGTAPEVRLVASGVELRRS